MAGKGSEAIGGEVSVEAVEGLIRELAGVLGVRLVINEYGGVREIHVLADTSRSAKSIVRDIESALMARWGIEIDHRRVSVAQLVDAPRRPRWVRLRVRRLAVTTDPQRGETEVAVRLAPTEPVDLLGRRVLDTESSEESWEGRAAGQSGATATVRLAAAATLHALDRALLRGHGFALADVGRTTLGGHEVINVLVLYRAPRGFSQLLAGAAVIRGDVVDAGVRAALSATNRVAAVAMRRRGDTPDTDIDASLGTDDVEGLDTETEGSEGSEGFEGAGGSEGSAAFGGAAGLAEPAGTGGSFPRSHAAGAGEHGAGTGR